MKMRGEILHKDVLICISSSKREMLKLFSKKLKMDNIESQKRYARCFPYARRLGLQEISLER